MSPDVEGSSPAPVVHELKTWPVYFDAVERGEKTFEVRRDDRGFQKGDTLRPQRFDPELGFYTSVANPKAPNGRGIRQVERRIAWILTGGQHGIEPGYVVLGLGDVA